MVISKGLHVKVLIVQRMSFKSIKWHWSKKSNERIQSPKRISSTKNWVTHKSFKMERSTSCIFFGSTPPYTHWVSHEDFYVEKSMQLFMLGIALECRLCLDWAHTLLSLVLTLLFYESPWLRALPYIKPLTHGPRTKRKKCLWNFNNESFNVKNT